MLSTMVKLNCLENQDLIRNYLKLVELLEQLIVFNKTIRS